MPAMQDGTGSRRFRRMFAVGTAGLALVLGFTGTAVAVPPPPPNPSDSELQSGRAEQRKRASQVGSLTSELARAEDRLARLGSEVGRKLELANKARVDMTTAQGAAKDSKREAELAGRESIAAGEGIEKARQRLDEFIAGSYQQGSTIGSASAYIGSKSPEDVLARSSMLQAVGESHLDALEGMRQARLEKSNADAAAREALKMARAKQLAAERAKRTADTAHDQAVQARMGQAERAKSLEADRDRVQHLLFEAQSTVRGLEGQRARYDEWLAAKRREEALKAQQAALAAASNNNSNSNSNSGGNSAPAIGGVSVESVIARAMSQLGLPYAWGGGNSNGPTYGIRDGGVADSFGDYMKIGFDCSGLMIYAFANVTALPHYSGYQYNYGRRVPLSQMRRGDMLFWGNGGIHHVALYLGGGQMIEAPQSGLRVRVAPVRYGDIVPYAARLIG